MYFYIKKAHVGKIPGIAEFLNEFIDEKAMGQEGYLTEKGLIPLGKEKYNAVSSDVKNLNNLSL